MLTYQILEEENIVVMEPKGSLSEEDLQRLTTDVNRQLDRSDLLKGILVHSKEFPGWENLQGMIAHLCFVRDHHRKIRKVALASDYVAAEIAPKLVNHFVSAEVRVFGYDDMDAALEWLRDK